MVCRLHTAEWTVCKLHTAECTVCKLHTKQNAQCANCTEPESRHRTHLLPPPWSGVLDSPTVGGREASKRWLANIPDSRNCTPPYFRLPSNIFFLNIYEVMTFKRETLYICKCLGKLGQKAATQSVFCTFCISSVFTHLPFNLIFWSDPIWWLLGGYSPNNACVWLQLMPTFNRWKAPKRAVFLISKNINLCLLRKTTNFWLETQLLPTLVGNIDLGWASLAGTGTRLGLPQGCWLNSTSSVSRSPSGWSWWWWWLYWWQL